MTFHGVDGIELAGDAWGPPDGPLVVFLHGGGQTRHSWKASCARLADKGLRVIALDARGHGDSAWAPDGDYSRRALAGDLAEVLGQLGKPAVVVGASMGGLTALHASVDLADRMVGLVLVDVVPRPEEAGVARVIGFLTEHRDGFDTLDQAADAVAAYLTHRPRPKSHEGLKRNLRQRADGRWYWHWDPNFVVDHGGETLDQQAEALEAAARQLRMPVLLVRGRMSDVVSPQGVEAFRTLVPHADFVELSDAAHTAAGDDNDAFTDAVSEFVVAVAGQR
ncbi:alpha/beta hydrolase [Skermania sp. ID1734]|nr:alpha/beta hydrolase [Skermania sp. ID1734]